jgi:RimJ/RimL family protein N-acetyltransferase
MRSYSCLSNQVFEINGFSIIPIRAIDKFVIMKWRNEQVYHLRQRNLLTIEDQENYFKNTVTRLFEEKYPNQILFSFIKDKECIGYGGLVHINWIDKNAEISFIMDTSYESEDFHELWTHYLALIEKVAFIELGFHKVFTYAFDLRPHLYPMLINNGYEHEATLKEHCEFDGKFKNVLIHSKIKAIPYLKKATVKDVDITYEWAIHPAIRQYSFSKSTIQHKEHLDWFKSKVDSSNCFYYILFLESTPLGSIRLDVNNKAEGLISYLVDPSSHGKGYGKLLLRKIEKIVKNSFITVLVGHVLKDNHASLKIFRDLDYKEHEEEDKFTFEKRMK